MIVTLDRLRRLCVTCALVLALVALAAGRDVVGAVAPASDCDDTCKNGLIGDTDPCISSATGECKVSATAPQGTLCVGCNFTANKDKNGKVFSCTHSCQSVVP